MRPPSDMPRRQTGRRFPTGRGRTVLIVGAVLLFVLVTSLRGIAGFWTDYLWFDSLGLTGVWGGVLGARLALALIFMGIFFLLAWGNLLIADRIAPRFRPSTGEGDLVDRYHDLVGRRTGLVRAGVAVVFALIAGAGVSARWNDWILFTNRVDFNQQDETFGADIAFYVFQLPFLNFVLSWLFSSLVIVTIISLVAHYLNGGIRLQAPGQRVSPQVKAHLSVLLGVLALVKAGQYWLDRYELVFSRRGFVQGATYTDVNVQLRAIYLLVLISLFAFVLFIANIWRRGWVLPVLAVGLWAFVALLAGEAVPAFVQRFRVEPEESAKELPYIRNNIEATRNALGLGGVENRPFSADGELTGQQLQGNTETTSNIRLWEPEVMQEVYDRLQGLRSFYDVNDVDVDRYEIDGEMVQVLLAARDLSVQGVPQQSWEGTHLRYTHGYGAIMSPANAKTASGEPEQLLSDIPVQSIDGAPEVEQSAVYIGEGLSGYVFVNTDAQEILYQEESGRTVFESYKGQDGIRIGDGIGGFLRRAGFALRFGDIDPLISGSINGDSSILIQRDVKDRLETVAPFLSFDADPYPVIVDGRIQYIADAYTTSSRYPNAERADTVDLPEESGLRGEDFNYIRNSVKAVVDAYDGTVTLYVVDEEDPLAQAYQQAFPELFAPASEAPQEMRDHFRYPEDLFRVQTSMWARYHVTDPTEFYNGNDFWNVAPDPGTRGSAPDDTAVTTLVPPTQEVVETGQPNRIAPTYQYLQLPGDEDASFVMQRPFVPQSGQDSTNRLTAFMVARSDPDEYGQLETFVMPSDNLPRGPQLAAADMAADREVAELETLLCQRGSACNFGNMLLIPIEQSLLYIRPLYIQAESAQVPQLQQVIVSFEDENGENQVRINPTLSGALEALFGVAPETREEDPRPGEMDQPDPDGQPPDGTEPPEEGQPPAPDPTEEALIEDLLVKLQQAEQARLDGDLVAYAQRTREAEDIANELEAVRDGEPSGPAADPNGQAPESTTTTPGSTTTTAPPTPPPGGG